MFGPLTSFQDSLLDEFWRLHQEMDEMLGDGLSSGGWIRSPPRGTFPAINLIQTPTDVQVYLFAPGVDPKKLDVSVQQGLLTVSGERQVPVHDEKTHYRRERFSGEFRRAISLGDDVDPDKVEAKYRDGILQVQVRRRESAKPRQIEIH
jgi:HSP20 family protein